MINVMGIPREPKPAKLVVSVFMKDTSLFQQAAGGLCESFGSVDMVSAWLPFNKTDYYTAEIGSPLFRRLIAFCKLIEQDTLADVKLFANRLEDQFSKDGKRLVNIDPGYLLAERFVLATGKNYTHRVYLREGIYADLTLIYCKGRFRSLDWTYPDYAGGAIINFLKSVRDRYMYQMKECTKVPKVC
jgi:hypothetical protein